MKIRDLTNISNGRQVTCATREGHRMTYSRNTFEIHGSLPGGDFSYVGEAMNLSEAKRIFVAWVGKKYD